MFKTLIKKYYFQVCILIGLLVYLLQRFNVHIHPLINNYFNDLLCIPIVLKIGLCSVRYIKSDKRLKLPLPLQIVVTLLYVVYFEAILPHINDRYTADVWDVVAYLVGLLLFICIEGFHKK